MQKTHVNDSLLTEYPGIVRTILPPRQQLSAGGPQERKRRGGGKWRRERIHLLLKWRCYNKGSIAHSPQGFQAFGQRKVDCTHIKAYTSALCPAPSPQAHCIFLCACCIAHHTVAFGCLCWKKLLSRWTKHNWMWLHMSQIEMNWNTNQYQ